MMNENTAKSDFLRQKFSLNDVFTDRMKILIFAFFLLVFINSCKMSKVKIEEIKNPPASSEGITDAALATQVNTNVNAKSIDIKERFGDFDKRIFTHVEKTDWQTLNNFYKSELAKFNFKRTTNVPSGNIDADIIYYEKTTEAKQKAAVFLIETYGDNSKQFVLLCLSK